MMNHSGCKDRDIGRLLKEVFEAPYFRIVVVNDEKTVELCGALKVSNSLGTFLKQQRETEQ